MCAIPPISTPSSSSSSSSSLPKLPSVVTRVERGMRVDNSRPTDKVIDRLLVESGYNLMLNDLETYKARVPDYDTVLNTIKGIAILNKYCNGFKRGNLTERVSKIAGMSIHAKENYPTVETFQETVHHITKTILDTYHQAETPKDKIRMFNHGLNYKGCFEGKVSQFLDYVNKLDNPTELIKYEIQDLNISKGRHSYDAITLDELIKHLTTESLFEKYGIDKETFRTSTIVTDLINAEYVLKADRTVNDVISEVMSLYTDWGSGREHLKETLKANPNLTDADKLILDALIDQYFERNPERLPWL